MCRTHLHFRFFFHQIHAIRTAVRTPTTVFHLRRSFQRHPLLQERNAQFLLDLIRLILPVKKNAPLQRYRFIRRYQLVTQRLIDRVQPLTGLLTIRP